MELIEKYLDENFSILKQNKTRIGYRNKIIDAYNKGDFELFLHNLKTSYFNKQYDSFGSSEIISTFFELLKDSLKNSNDFTDLKTLVNNILNKVIESKEQLNSKNKILEFIDLLIVRFKALNYKSMNGYEVYCVFEEISNSFNNKKCDIEILNQNKQKAGNKNDTKLGQIIELSKYRK